MLWLEIHKKIYNQHQSSLFQPYLKEMILRNWLIVRQLDHCWRQLLRLLVQ